MLVSRIVREVCDRIVSAASRIFTGVNHEYGTTPETEVKQRKDRNLAQP
jgi:hypothetical protein